MALENHGVICQSQIARAMASNISSADELKLDAAAAINTGIENTLFSTTLSLSGESSQDIQILTNLLQQLGYTVSISSTTLTINW